MSKILVVDDEAIITMQLEERLNVMGYTVAGMAAPRMCDSLDARRPAPRDGSARRLSRRPIIDTILTR